jgi:hypothetical protein
MQLIAVEGAEAGTPVPVWFGFCLAVTQQIPARIEPQLFHLHNGLCSNNLLGECAEQKVKVRQ